MTAVTTGFAPFREYRTWYRVTGDLGSGVPLVALHGGPGCVHNYLLSLTDLAGENRAVVHYDQLGNGESTHLPDADPSFWTPELFVEELDNLLEHLGIAGSYDLLGQSWGGMLAAEHAVRRPSGLRRLVIANSPASMDLWCRAADQLRAQLPAEVLETLERHEAAGDFDHPDYQAATQVFYDRHMCRVVPNPPDVARALELMDANPAVYRAMNGPTEFHVIGSLREWNIVDRLHLVSVPTLVINGRHDEATDDCVRPYAERIPDARRKRFENSSHLPHVEERQSYMDVVGEFLTAEPI
ncbi:MAG: proline iminopeptidase-family hydrolase [Actinocatenispora sp.]